MWIFYVALVVSSGSLYAFPQNNGAPGSFEVDGFFFDGPANGQSPTPTPLPTTSSTTTLDLDMNACLSGCSGTPEYNPVCGSNSVDYDNPGRLNCAAFCGVDVTISYFGKCVSAGTRG